MTLSRRTALTFLSAAAACAAPGLSLAAPAGRRLSFSHIHTGERLSATYRTEGGYDAGALSDINHVLRDWRTGEVATIDPALLDDIYDVQARLGHGAGIEVICGYRSPQTNAVLADAGTGVAKRSLHMQGRAIDITLPGVGTLALRDAALALARGGVGTYTSSGFVHLDTGRVRRWGG
jgi:uncharacterized protein YcbK (DUF882 family)